MHPILFSIGGFDIHVWGLMVSLGAAAGYMTALRFAEGSRFTESILWGYFFYAIPVGLAGARLWEVLFSWQNYAADPLQGLLSWHGGIPLQGALSPIHVRGCRREGECRSEEAAGYFFNLY